MADSIFLIQGESNLVEMKETPYDSEAILQKLIAKYPNVLAGEQMNSDAPRRWLLVTREMSVPDDEDGGGRWSLDHLFLDQDAIPTLVEVKRSSDTRIRREVVGQLLDYAANAVAYWPVEQVRAKFEAGYEESDAHNEVAKLIEANAENTETKVEEFWQQVKTNLQAGRIRMVFVADEIPRELRRIIEFLNGQMDPAEVLGIELKQFQDQSGGSKTLVPRLFGQTSKSQQKKVATSTIPKKVISETEFSDFVSTFPAFQVATEAVMSWTKRRGMTASIGRGVRLTTFIPTLELSYRTVYPVSLKLPHGRLVFQMQYVKRYPPFDSEQQRKQLQLRLEKVAGFRERGGMTAAPCIELQDLKTSDDTESLLDVLDWMFDELVRADKAK